MTSRMHTPHTTCPSCHEVVYLDELVGGRCPLCGYSLDDDGEVCSEFDETLERSDLGWMIFTYFMFKRFDDLGVNPLNVMQMLSRYEEGCTCDLREIGMLQYELETRMSYWERLIPKRCSKCGRIFFRGGKSVIAGCLGRQDYVKRYICTAC
ncbi:MAG: hypothetical protein KO206_08265 [Methanomicrobiaceae archaeon]|uniref:Uncharacterized protein n=1 Tax=hydrocarbon metagenome TaxID=938273 RepID=A0A0W8FIK9_9ZZZZ|nr:hypothetical protein [Methanomicrobiaceae archaeon]MDD5419110.1 hypothetical protein [Methanomicrobiaceae archaeon]